MTRPVWQRNPRYTLSVFVILAVTFYLLSPYQLSSQSLAPQVSSLTHNVHDLPARMERAERIYNKVLHDRQGLIRKFGPTPRDVEMYVCRESQTRLCLQVDVPLPQVPS